VSDPAAVPIGAGSPRDPWTNVYGVARTVLALGTGSALLADPADLLFRPLGLGIGDVVHDVALLKLSLFALLSGEWLGVARWLAIGALAVVASGWRPRVTGVLHWWISASFAGSSVIVEGGDQIVAVLTLLLIPVTLTDPRRWHWQAPHGRRTGAGAELTSLVARSALGVARLQVAIVYFVSSTAKLSVPEWVNGTALYYWFLHPVFGLAQPLRGWIVPALGSPLLVTLATWGVIAFEALLVSGLLMERRWRPQLLRLGLLFHLGIVVVHGLMSFFFAMAGALVLYLRPVEETFAFPDRLRALAARIVWRAGRRLLAASRLA